MSKSGDECNMCGTEREDGAARFTRLRITHPDDQVQVFDLCPRCGTAHRGLMEMMGEGARLFRGMVKKIEAEDPYSPPMVG